MMEDRVPLAVGMEVVDLSANRIGHVKEVRERDFLVDRSLKRDVYVPVHDVNQVQDDIVVLNTTIDVIDDMGWEHPPIVGSAS